MNILALLILLSDLNILTVYGAVPPDIRIERLNDSPALTDVLLALSVADNGVVGVGVGVGVGVVGCVTVIVTVLVFTLPSLVSLTTAYIL